MSVHLGDLLAGVSGGLNPLVVVVREGIEAVLIVASLGASLQRSTRRRLRLALWSGVGLAGAGTLLTWMMSGALLETLQAVSRYLEAAVSLLSVVVLLLITNWFFHRVYWTGWVARFHAQKRRRLNSGSGELLGMVVLGFTSTYREGLETVLFLQALALQTSNRAVLGGALAGVVVVVLAGVVVLGLQLRMPYRRLLVATGLMISGVLVVMTGNTVHAMQEVGWLGVTPGPWNPPGWAGAWLGAYGTVEAMAGQLLAATVVFGSYWFAERRQRGPGLAAEVARTGWSADLSY